MKTITIRTTEIFTPRVDPSLGRPFTGNHLGFASIIERRGDLVTESHLGRQGWANRPLLRKTTHSISNLIAEAASFAAENGWQCEVIDDLPEGVWYPSPA
jgi:hypothetical protein